jgi:hypothetical protein
MTDIVERLRDYRGGDVGVWNVMEEAADEITRLTAENERLRLALDEAQQAFALESYNAERLKRSRDRYRVAWEEEKRRFTADRVALEETSNDQS